MITRQIRECAVSKSSRHGTNTANICQKMRFCAFTTRYKNMNDEDSRDISISNKYLSSIEHWIHDLFLYGPWRSPALIRVRKDF